MNLGCRVTRLFLTQDIRRSGNALSVGWTLWTSVSALAFVGLSRGDDMGFKDLMPVAVSVAVIPAVLMGLNVLSGTVMSALDWIVELFGDRYVRANDLRVEVLEAAVEIEPMLCKAKADMKLLVMGLGLQLLSLVIGWGVLLATSERLGGCLAFASLSLMVGVHVYAIRRGILDLVVDGLTLAQQTAVDALQEGHRPTDFIPDSDTPYDKAEQAIRKAESIALRARWALPPWGALLALCPPLPILLSRLYRVTAAACAVMSLIPGFSLAGMALGLICINLGVMSAWLACPGNTGMDYLNPVAKALACLAKSTGVKGMDILVGQVREMTEVLTASSRCATVVWKCLFQVVVMLIPIMLTAGDMGGASLAMRVVLGCAIISSVFRRGADRRLRNVVELSLELTSRLCMLSDDYGMPLCSGNARTGNTFNMMLMRR